MNENDRKWNKEGRYATLVYEYMLILALFTLKLKSVE